MTATAANKLQARFCQELSRQLSLHRVVLLFDPEEQLRSLLDALATIEPSDEAPGGLNLGELQPQWVVAGTSLFALRHQLEPLVCADLPDPLLIYLPQRQEADCRATLLELIRAGTVLIAAATDGLKIEISQRSTWSPASGRAVAASNGSRESRSGRCIVGIHVSGGNKHPVTLGAGLQPKKVLPSPRSGWPKTTLRRRCVLEAGRGGFRYELSRQPVDRCRRQRSTRNHD